MSYQMCLHCYQIITCTYCVHMGLCCPQTINMYFHMFSIQSLLLNVALLMSFKPVTLCTVKYFLFNVTF